MFRSLALLLLTACVVTLLVACGGGPINQPVAKPDAANGKDKQPQIQPKEQPPIEEPRVKNTRRPPARLRPISLPDLREHCKNLEDKAFRISGRVTVSAAPLLDGAAFLTFFMSYDSDAVYGIALLRKDLNDSIIDPSIHSGHEFDVVLNGLVTSFEGGKAETIALLKFGGFAFMVGDVLEAKHVGIAARSVKKDKDKK